MSTTALDSILPLPPQVTKEDWPAEFPDHLSASQLTMFQRCAEQYRRRYVLGEKERPGAALVWGHADHYAHEQNFTQKIDSGEDIAVNDVKLAFAEGFDQEIERYGGESEVEWGNDKPGELKDKGVELVAVYHDLVSPRVQPLAVEENFSLELRGVPVPVIGRVDLRATISERAAFEQNVSTLPAPVAVERKTAKAAERKVKPQWRIQGLLYQAVEALPVEWHVSVKTKTPAVYTPEQNEGLRLPLNERTVEVTKVLVQNSVRAMLAYWRMYGPNEPWPGAITHPWACDFCGFRPSCMWWPT